MLHELQPDQYSVARPLFEGLWYHLVILSAVEGHTPARIVVDDVDAPAIAFLWDKVEGGYYLAGEPGDEAVHRALNAFILGEVYPEARAMESCHDFAFNYHPETWESHVDMILAGTNPKRYTRKHFLFKELRFPDWRACIPEGMEMVHVDGAFLARTDLRHLDERVLRWVRHAWGSVEGFLERGFGCCLVEGDTLVSWCTGDYAVGSACEMGIGTDEHYRRRGLATLTVSATVEQCLERGFADIGWHCWSSNAASAATARKVGFAQTVEHPVYHAWYNAVDNWLVQGITFTEEGLYPAAVEAFGRALATVAADPVEAQAAHLWTSEEAKPYLLRDVASAHLHTGDLGALRSAFDQFLAHGWDLGSLRRFMEEEAFSDLQGSAGWKILMGYFERAD